MTSLTSTFLLPGFKLDGGKTSSGKEVDDKGSDRTPCRLSTLQFPVEPMGHFSFPQTDVLDTCFQMGMFWTLFSFPRTDVLWTDTLVFHGHGPDTLRFSTDGQFSTDYRSSGHFSKSNHSSDSSQTSKKPPASKLLEFDLGHLRDGTWNISGDMGLVSAGRINKDTPPLTTPSHTSKSSAMDISSHIF